MKYEQSIDIIQSVIERYENGLPQIFKKLNQHEKELLKNRPKHLFSTNDCIDIIKQCGNYSKFNWYIEIVSKCVLTLYKWYKSKIIYLVEDSTNYLQEKHIRIDKYKLDLFPYSGMYIKSNFYRNEYVGCFISITKEKFDYSLKKCLVISFVQYDERKSFYFLEPFLLPITDEITVEDSFMEGIDKDNIPTQNLYANVKSAEEVVSVLYCIIDSLVLNKEIKNTATISQNVHQTNMKIKNSKNYRITHESKYKYIKNTDTVGTGSAKSPHTRRSHLRKLNIKDDNGNVIGKRTITVSESHIHADKEKIISIKSISL